MNASFWPIVGIGILLLWVIYAAIALDIPIFFVEWYKSPGNSIRLITWIGSIFIVLITGFNSTDSLLGSLRNDAITVAVTVIVIEEVGRYRAALEEKERIIRQMASHSNDFALDAVRQIMEKGWHRDGSLREKSFDGARLQNVTLGGIDLQQAVLWEANLQKGYLVAANLQGAFLLNANLQDALLVNAKLQEAILTGANLQKAYLINANLQGARLEHTDLQRASLEGANLDDTDLTSTMLSGATYSIEAAVITWPAGIEVPKTVWPFGFDPIEAGAKPRLWDEKKGKWCVIRNAELSDFPFDD